MMVAEFIERQNTSPMNGETGLHNSGPMNRSNGNPVTSLHSNLSGSNSNSSNNNANGPSGCNVGYCFIEPELGVMTRDSNDSNASEDGSQQFPSNYEMNHMQRKDLFSQRKQREFIPDNKKDESYWDRRRRNNEAAKRSREKRRYNDMILEQRVVELSKENHFLKAQLSAIKDKYGISGEAVVNVEQVMATLPTNDQVLSITKRAKMNNPPPPILYQSNPVSVPIPTPVIHRTAVGPSPPLVPLHPAAVYPVESESYQPEPSERYPFPFTPVLPPLNPPVLEAAGNSVLNLSRSRSPAGPYELPLPLEQPSGASSLPHKLRHKSHLGDKDVAATALLSLHNIKQEPGSRASPPWDGEGSSDERDSGISLGAEWIMTPHNLTTEPHHSPSHDCIETEDDDATHIKSEVARLASEVASLKSLLSRKKTSTIPTN